MLVFGFILLFFYSFILLFFYSFILLFFFGGFYGFCVLDF
ncbi:putative membrane protein [Helicobacter pylori Hp H-24c]|nr:putative membrane protein [Helicobacter pylori Hp H-24c]